MARLRQLLKLVVKSQSECGNVSAYPIKIHIKIQLTRRRRRQLLAALILFTCCVCSIFLIFVVVVVVVVALSFRHCRRV